MNDARDRLLKECERKKINWNTVNKCVTALGSSINDKDEYGETALSEAIMSCGGGNTESPRLVRLIRTFLDKGYDLNANNRFNGGICLHALCYSTYTSEILEAAELLLDNGADPFCPSDEKDESHDVLCSISFKLGYWEFGDMSCANLFEAYYAMIKAAQDGEDYHGIHTFSECVGKNVKKIEQLSLSDGDMSFNRSSERYKGAYAIWCDNIPLIISREVDFVVNPLFPSKAVCRTDRSCEFSQTIGKTVESLEFLSAGIARLRFDDGSYLLFGNNYSQDSYDYFAWVEYRSECRDLPDIKAVTRVLFRSGGHYSDSCRSYSEDEVFLDCGECLYAVFSVGKDYSEHGLVSLRLPKEWFSGLSRTLEYEDFCFDGFISGEGGKMRGLRLHCGDNFLYLLATEFSGVKVMLEPKPIENTEEISCYTEGSKIVFCEK